MYLSYTWASINHMSCVLYVIVYLCLSYAELAILINSNMRSSDTEDIHRLNNHHRYQLRLCVYWLFLSLSSLFLKAPALLAMGCWEHDGAGLVGRGAMKTALASLLWARKFSSCVFQAMRWKSRPCEVVHAVWLVSPCSAYAIHRGNGQAVCHPAMHLLQWRLLKEEKNRSTGVRNTI